MREALVILGFLALTIPCSADIIYVKEGGTGGGTSWADAYGDLQDGLDNADPNYVIWVAAGTYKPTIEVGGSGERYKTFQMKKGVAIYGGFPDTGDPDMADRDPDQFETILSGDLLGNDNPNTPVEDLHDDPCRADNCYHVFYHPNGLALDSNAILDGFTITGGNGSDVHYSGGGMYNRGSSPTVTNCTFSDNSAHWGGGMYNFNSSPTVT